MKNSFITEIDFDKELSIGAEKAINSCLRLKPEERITIITDIVAAAEKAINRKKNS